MKESQDLELEALLQRYNALIDDDAPPEEPSSGGFGESPQKQPRTGSGPESSGAPTAASRRAEQGTRQGCRGCLVRLMVVLLILALLMGGVWYWLSRKSQGGLHLFRSPAETAETALPTSYTRKEGVSTILLAGTDKDGLRTDTILLLYIDSASGNLDLLSIPRDTLVWGGYSVPKINSAYGWVGGGQDGMEELMDRVQELLGYRPDAYCAIGLDTLVEAVDLMGGVEFNVPVDMVYSDPWQGLEINLRSGLQTLNGEQAMGVLRFRSGYAMADLQRVEVQRDFLKAAVRQWATPSKLTKLPKILSLVQDQAITNLDQSNLLWLARAVLGGDLSQAETATLPGAGVNWSSGSYYVADPASVLALINERYNIYCQDLTAEMLNIRLG